MAYPLDMCDLISLPQGLNLCSLHWMLRVLTTGPPGKSPCEYFDLRGEVLWAPRLLPFPPPNAHLDFCNCCGHPGPVRITPWAEDPGGFSSALFSGLQQCETPGRAEKVFPDPTWRQAWVLLAVGDWLFPVLLLWVPPEFLDGFPTLLRDASSHVGRISETTQVHPSSEGPFYPWEHTPLQSTFFRGNY